MPPFRFLATQLSFLDEDRVHRLPVQIPLEKGAMAKTKADMWELSGCNAAETRPSAEASTRPFSVGRKSQLISTRNKRLLSMATRTHLVYTQSQWRTQEFC
jgi:hypothetical protein